MGKQEKSESWHDQLSRLRRAGLPEDEYLRPREERIPPEGSGSEKLRQVLELLSKARKKKPDEMICVISYDIGEDKVRREIAKFLIKQGCHRVQKSVYFAQLPRAKYEMIVQTLSEVQALYENEDSIFVLPIGEDNLHRMELIGKNVQVEVLVEARSTLFF
jgi:CRISPR-associated endonuclease Cas2